MVAWSPLKLYRSARFDSAATTLTLNGGVLDPAVGKSYHQIAMAGRSLHRSQDMGQLQRIGPSLVRLALVEDRTSGGAELFDGIDTTLAAMPLGERRGPGMATVVYGVAATRAQSLRRTDRLGPGRQGECSATEESAGSCRRRSGRGRCPTATGLFQVIGGSTTPGESSWRTSSAI